MATRRNYLTFAELKTRLGDNTLVEATYEPRLDLAEELIDVYVGFQSKFLPIETEVEVSAVNSTVINDTGSGSQLGQIDDYFKGAIARIIGGTGTEGQERRITASDKDDKSITVDSAFDPQVSTDTLLKIYQIGKFPRHKDVETNRAGTKYYKLIPEAVKAAVAAQVEFITAKGDAYFENDNTDVESERIGNYAYSKGSGQAAMSNLAKMIAPQARALLRGIKNSFGKLEVDNPTNI